MDSKLVGGCHRKAASKYGVHVLHLQVCSSYLILFFAVLATLFCFVYFEILQFTPSGGLLFNISAFRSLSHLASHSFTHTHGVDNTTFNSARSPFFHQDTSHGALSPSYPPSIAPYSNKNPLVLPNIKDPFFNLSSSPSPFVQLSPSSSPPVNSFPQSDLSSFNPILNVSDAIDGMPSSPSPSPSLKEPVKSSTWSSGSAPEEAKGGSNGSSTEASEHEDEDIISARPQQKLKPGECDLFEGKWVRDESYPLYESRACPFVDGGFRCQENGRPDDDYLKWRWQPSGCSLPRFNGEDMLNRLRGARLVFVGDSIGRNQWESLLCMLFKAVHNKTRIYEVNGEPITKHKGFLIFKFEAYDCTIEYYRSPFLVPQGRPPQNSPEGVRTTLRVDTMDWTSKRWIGASVIVFNDGHWWSYEKTIRGGCYFQVGSKVNKNMSVRDGFERAMQTWRRWVTSNIDPHKTRTFFRTYAPVHFSGGTWKTGGRCDEEREPYAEGSLGSEGEPWSNGVVRAEAKQVPHVTLLDITHLSQYRKDAHASIYNVGPSSQPRAYNRQDCSHWCLPGLPDTWNELLYASLLQGGQGP